MSLRLIRPSGAPDPVADEVVTRLVDLWAAQGEAWGLGRTPARVHAWLFASAEPASLEELAARLELSPSSAGAACRVLREWGLIRQVTVPGDRRDFYEALPEVEAVVKTIIRERQRRELAPALRELAEIEVRLSGAPPPPERRVKRADLVRRIHDLHRAAKLADQFADALIKERGLATWIARRFGRFFSGR